MLALFIVRRNFNKLKVSLVVDAEHQDAELNVSYDARLKRSVAVKFHEVDTPEKAEAFLLRNAGIHGSLLESLEHQYRVLEGAQ